jgi:ethanolamine utilization microcompartment shell protein EutL
MQIVEREYGLLEVHSRAQEEVLAAGGAVLDFLGLTIADRVKPVVTSTQIITNVTAYQAQLINKWRKGNMLLPRQSLFVLEASPAAYVSLAANEAEKAANISIIEVRAVGRFGRIFLGGTESEVLAAKEAAIASLEGIDGRAQ